MTTCPICLSVILQGKECRTDCNHVYCYNCLHRWFDKKKIRVRIVGGQLIILHIIMKILKSFLLIILIIQI